VIVNGTSSTRADLMPYGGTKRSGFGREGPKYAAEELTELRTVVFYN
jgi:succinate-semialdehyde dehydrogenase/glutarate-semialdehyde dehydrogenase